MKKLLLVLFSVFSIFAAKAQCDYTINGADTYGDGWNNGFIEVKINSTVYTTFSVPSSAEADEVVTLSIPTYTGDAVSFTWNSGSYDSEVRFSVFSPDGTELYEYGIPPADENIFVTDTSVSTCAAPTCPDPSSLAASGETATTVDLAWTIGDSESLWDLELVDVTASGSATGTPTTEDVTSNPYTLSGLTPENEYKIYLRADCSGDNSDASDWIGPVSFTTPPTCPDPSSLAASGETATTVDLAWTIGDSESLWDLELVDVTASGSATGTPTTEDVTSNPYTLSGLTPENEYKIYLRADCSGDNSDTSDWVGPVSFTTLCSAYTIPYNEGFETGYTQDSDVGGCIIQENISGTYAWRANDTRTNVGQSPRTGSWNATIYYNWNSPNTDWMFIPVSLTAGQSYDFEAFARHYYSNNIGNITVSYGNTPSAAAMTTTIVAETSTNGGTTGGDYLQIAGSFTPSATATYYIGIKGYLGSSYDALSIDDISIVETPTCPVPSSLAASGETATTVDLDWTAGDSETLWDLELVDVTASGSATGTPTTEDVTTNPYTLSGLTPENEYQVYLRADCGAGDTSDWVGPVSFTTLCNAYTIPYNEGFEIGYTHNTPVGDCLIQESISGSNDWLANDTYTSSNRSPRSGSWNATLYYNNTDWIFIPVSLTASQTYYFDMFARQDTSNPYMAKITVSYGDTASATAMTNAIVSETGIVNGDYQQIAGQFTAASTATYWIGVKGYLSSSYNFISIDDISINTCPTPSSLAASGETATTVDLDWTAGDSETLWDIELVDVTASGSATGTPNTENVTTNPYTLSGLTPENEYEIYLRADCSGDNSDAGNWVGPVSFTTPPTCPDPSSLAASGETATTVDLAWTAGDSESLWDLELVDVTASGSATGTPTTEDVTTNPYTLSGLTPENEYKIYLRADCSGDNSDASDWIGPVSFTTLPTCPDPSSLAASGETTTTVDLDWTNGDGESLWDIELVDVTASGSATGTPTEDDVTTNPYTLSGLTSNNNYKVYLRANCGVGDTSNWVGPVSFTTLPDCGDSVTFCYDGGLTKQSSLSSVGDFITVTINSGSTETDYDNLVIYDSLDNSGNVLYNADGNHTGISVTSTTGIISVYTNADGSYDCVDGSGDGSEISLSYSCVTPYNWSGTASSDWATASNWSTGAVPTSNDDVYIDGTFANNPSISNTDAVAKKVIVASGNTLTIDETSSLTVSGDFTNTGTVTLNSTEDDFSSLIVEGTATGDITYNRYVNSYDTNPGGGGWDLVGAPAGMTIADFITANGDNIKVLGDNYAFGPYDNAAGQWNLYATTTTNTCTTGGTETFTNIGSSSTSSSTRTWTGDDGSTWTATNARTDQTINGAAITLDDDKANTYVQSGTISGGICNITISTQRAFGGNSGNLDVLINGSSVGTVPYSASVQTTTISDINITGDIVIRIDNNIGGNSGGGDDRVIIDDVTWTANTAQDLGSFTTGQGYAMTTNTGDGATVAFTGPLQTTSQSINVINNDAANGGAGRKWNLVSNPFPSYINGNTAAQATNNFLEANSSVFESEYIAVYGWSGTAWSIYNQLTGAFSMAPGQAFWISAASTSEVALDFTAAMRTTTGTGDFVLGPQPLTYNVELILKDESKKAITNFYFKDGLSLDLDPGYDAGAYNQSMALSTRLAWGSQETAFSINAMGMDAMQNTRVPLEIRQNVGQAFTISIADMELPQDIYVYLEDTLNGTLTSLKENDFELTAQSDLSGADRFFVVFKSNSVLSSGDTLGVDALNVFKANNDDFVTIAGITPDLGQLDVRLYSMLGQTVRQDKLNTTTATQTISTQGLASGLYIVQIRSGNQTTVKKIIVK
jgi:hypothetical protein